MHCSQITFPRIQTITNQPILGKYLLSFRLAWVANGVSRTTVIRRIESVCIGCRELQQPGTGARRYMTIEMHSNSLTPALDWQWLIEITFSPSASNPPTPYLHLHVQALGRGGAFIKCHLRPGGGRSWLLIFTYSKSSESEKQTKVMKERKLRWWNVNLFLECDCDMHPTLHCHAALLRHSHKPWIRNL